jgi:hypothetical protein
MVAIEVVANATSARERMDELRILNKFEVVSWGRTDKVEKDFLISRYSQHRQGKEMVAVGIGVYMVEEEKEDNQSQKMSHDVESLASEDT